MTRLLKCAALLVAVCWTAPTMAQNPTPAPPSDSLSSSVNQTWASPTYAPPTAKELVRAKEQAKTQQRLNRIATRKWFGFSNIRPTVSPTPWSAGYSPGWVSNTARPFMWAGVGSAW